MFRLTLTTLALGVAAFVAGEAAAQGQPRGTLLSGADLRQLLSKSIISDGTYHRTNTRGSIVWEPGGTMLIQYLPTHGIGSQDSGTWRIQADQICATYKRIEDAREHCFRYFQIGENRYQSWSELGILAGTFQLRPEVQ